MTDKEIAPELKITPIRNGTVIDHITSGKARIILKILGISENSQSSIISIAMNVSGKSGKKDIVKIEDVELKPKDIDKIALISPKATINIIRNYKVIKKHKVKLPDVIEGIVKCSNPSCITNTREPVQSKFIVISKEPARLRCYYCERELKDIANNIIV